MKKNTVKLSEKQLKTLMGQMVNEALNEFFGPDNMDPLDYGFFKHDNGNAGRTLANAYNKKYMQPQQGQQQNSQPQQGQQQPMNESQLRKIVAESIKKVLKEMDDFTPHGYKTMNNYGGNEIQINKSGDAARLKFQDGEITDWLEIEFDEDGVAYVTTPYGEQEKLSDYMKY